MNIIFGFKNQQQNLKLLIIVLGYFSVFSSINAQGLWTTYQTSNTGTNTLLGNNIYEISEDTLNNLWFATSYGLSKFDGINWNNYLPFGNLPNVQINCIKTDESNNVWVGNSSGNGLARFDGNTWTIFNSSNGLINNSVTGICINDSVIWVGTNKGISKYNGSFFTDFEFGDSIQNVFFNIQTGQFDTNTVFQNFRITSMAVDHLDNFWAAGYYYDGSGFTGILRMYNGNIWTDYTPSADGVIDSLITCIAVDDSGNIWFGSKNGVSKYNYSSWTNFTATDGLISNYVKSIAVDSTGAIWFGTPNGASGFDGNTWNDFTKNDGLISNAINSIYTGINGNIWFCTSYGATMYDGTTCVSYSSNDGLISNSIRTIDASENGIWFGTADGASFFDGKNWKGYTVADGLSGNYITAIEEEDNGNIWFGITNAPVTILSNVSDTILGNTTWHVYDFLKDLSGNIWFGSYYNLFKFDGANWTYFPLDSLSQYGIKSLALDSNGNIWAGFTWGIIGKFDGSVWSLDTLGDGNGNYHVTSIAVDSSGNVWSHGDGLYKFDGNNWQKFDSLNGFSNNETVLNVAIDKSNHLWVTTANGVWEYDGSNFKKYSTADGLVDNYIGNVGVDKYNNKWFGNYGSGLSKYCESMFLQGNVYYEGNNVVNGKVYLYKTFDNSFMELADTTSIDNDGHFQFSLTSAGNYIVSAIANLATYPNTIESYYHPGNNPCNNFELIRISCGDTISNIDISLAVSGGSISANFISTDNGNGNYSFNNISSGNFIFSKWAFGDGYSSEITSPDHTFVTNGTFAVVLAVADSSILTGGSCVDYSLQTISVNSVINPVQCNSAFVIYADTITNYVFVINSSTGNNLTFLWDFGDGDTSTQQLPDHSYLSAGPFYLCLTVDDGAGCNELFCDSIGILGVVFKQSGFTISVIPPPVVTGMPDKIESNSLVEIYPNPTSPFLSIKNKNLAISEVTIMTVNSKILKTITTGFNEVDVSDLASGIYFIKIISNIGIITRKFVKQ